MNRGETTGCAEFGDEVSRYAWGDISEDRRTTVEAHLKECGACREHAQFVRDLIDAVREDSQRQSAAQEPCPETSLIVDLEAEELDEPTAKQVTGHLLYCKRCRDAYLLLHGFSAAKLEERALEEADAQEIERRRIEIHEVLTRIAALHASIKSRERLGVPKQLSEPLNELHSQVLDLLLEIKRAFLAPVEGEQAYHFRVSHQLLGALREIEERFIEVVLEYVPKDLVPGFSERHKKLVESSYVEWRYKYGGSVDDGWLTFAPGTKPSEASPTPKKLDKPPTGSE